MKNNVWGTYLRVHLIKLPEIPLLDTNTLNSNQTKNSVTAKSLKEKKKPKPFCFLGNVSKQNERKVSFHANSQYSNLVQTDLLHFDSKN